MDSTRQVAEAGRDSFRSPGALPFATRQVDVRSISRAAQTKRFCAVQYDLSETTDQDMLLRLVDRWNGDPEIHGILTRLSLPLAIDARRARKRVSPLKDVDVGPSLLGLVGVEPMTTATAMVNTCER
jgi:hypothetical protein